MAHSKKEYFSSLLESIQDIYIRYNKYHISLSVYEIALLLKTEK